MIDDCPVCHGKGWHYETLSDDPDEPSEVYCRCPEGAKRAKHDDDAMTAQSESSTGSE